MRKYCLVLLSFGINKRRGGISGCNQNQSLGKSDFNSVCFISMQYDGPITRPHGRRQIGFRRGADGRCSDAPGAGRIWPGFVLPVA
jgi:hypothetical protein